jgi:hypothetical protein
MLRYVMMHSGYVTLRCEKPKRSSFRRVRIWRSSCRLPYSGGAAAVNVAKRKTYVIRVFVNGTLVDFTSDTGKDKKE